MSNVLYLLVSASYSYNVCSNSIDWQANYIKVFENKRIKGHKDERQNRLWSRMAERGETKSAMVTNG